MTKEVLYTTKLALTVIIMHIKYVCSTYVSVVNNEIIIKRNACNTKCKMYKHNTIHYFCSIGRYVVCFNIVLIMYYF